MFYFRSKKQQHCCAFSQDNHSDHLHKFIRYWIDSIPLPPFYMFPEKLKSLSNSSKWRMITAASLDAVFLSTPLSIALGGCIQLDLQQSPRTCLDLVLNSFLIISKISSCFSTCLEYFFLISSFCTSFWSMNKSFSWTK